MNEDFMEDLWASVFDASDYEGYTDYANYEDFIAANPNLGLGEEWAQELSDIYYSFMDYAQDNLDFNLEIPEFDEFGSIDDLLEFLEPFYPGDNWSYWTDQIDSFIAHHADEIEAWETGNAFQEYWDWKDQYTKYINPYDTKKEMYLKEDTERDVENFTSQFGDTIKKSQAATGRLNLDSGRASSLWGDVKKGLDLQIEKARIAEDMGIADLREAYKRNFYGSIMDIAIDDPGLLDPDQA